MPLIRAVFLWLADEVVAATANLAVHVGLQTTLGAFFLPRVSGRLLDLGFGGFRGAHLLEAWLIGLFERALRVNATQRIRRGAANRADLLGLRRHEDYGLFAAHGALGGSSSRQLHCIQLRSNIVAHCALAKKPPAARLKCPAASVVSSVKLATGCRNCDHRGRRHIRHRCRCEPPWASLH